MARGRFVSKEICVDKAVNKLSSPWSMLAFTWLIVHADREGRTYGDPSIVKSLVFPRLDDKITSKDVEGFIQEWHDLGLVIWYEVDGDKFIEFPNFEKHQIGMKKDREPESSIPENNVGKHPEDCPQNDGSLPAEVKGSKEKLSEEEEQVEVEVDGSDISLVSAFESISKLQAPRDPEDWNVSLQAMKNKGVTNQIMAQAVSELSEKNYKITGPKSIEQACAIILAKVKRESGPRHNEFSEYVKH